MQDGGTTPLLAAVKYGHDKCVVALLDAGANMDAVVPDVRRRMLLETCLRV